MTEAAAPRRTLTATIPWGRFSEKHVRYIHDWPRNRMMCAEGAIRSGKTIDHCIIAAMYLESCPDTYHLATGSTIGNAKLNIGVCNGFGLEALFRGRCKWGKFKDNEALFIRTPTGEKVVIFAGGGYADSYKRILGNSYGLWIATEINEHYDCEDSRQSFLKVAMGRQIAAQKPLTLWDLNPCYPEHTIYTQYIEPYRLQFVGGFRYEHFTLRDNATITAERMAEIVSQYVPGTVWYRRDINGERCVAQGLCFPVFADNPDPYIISDAEADKRASGKLVIGVDFGGRGSMSTLFLTDISRDYRQLTGLMEEGIPLSNRVDSQAICDAFVAFYREAVRRYGRVEWVFCDSASPTMINSLVSAARAAALPWNNITGVKKNPIADRPRTVDRLLTTGRLKLARRCNATIRAISNLRWDEKLPDQPEDKNIGNINDRWDAFCYSWLEFVQFIDRR